MSFKHYDANYLVDTAQIMINIKTTSYGPFLKIKEGKIIDLGCGTGNDVYKLAELNSNLSVIGIDHDPKLIEIANANLHLAPNASFLIGDSAELPFRESSISGLRAERLIQHIKDPNPTFKEVYRILVSNSPIVIIETDWSSLSFYCGDPLIGNKIVSYLTNQKVNNGYASKKTYNYLSEAGFKNIAIMVHPLISFKLSEIFTYLWVNRIIAEMEQLGFLTPEETSEFLEDLKIADEKKSFVCSMNIIVAYAQKP